jgi:hypothetical protein
MEQNYHSPKKATLYALCELFPISLCPSLFCSYNYAKEVLGYHVRKGLGGLKQEIIDGVKNEIHALLE